MSDNGAREGKRQDELYSKVMRAGRRTYFFDVRETKAGDYFLTITESKKSTNEDGSYYFKKHKIYLYKEDFANFKDMLNETTDYILNEKGEEVISERHQSDYTDSTTQNEDNAGNSKEENAENSKTDDSLDQFTDLNFEDI